MARLLPSSLLLALCCTGCGAEDPTPDLTGAPVVLVVFDALAAGHVGHLGHPMRTTPNLDALAAEGVSFTRTFAPTPYTLASIPSLLTGRLPDRHGVTQGEHVLPQDEVTLAELLADRGYQTFGAVANIQGGRLHDLDQGFEVYEELFRGDSHEAMEIVPPEAFTPVLERWLMERDPERPPFIYLHILQPHMPYDPPVEFRAGLIRDGYEGPFRDGMDRDWMLEFSARGGMMHLGDTEDHLTHGDALAIQGLYDANIRHADAQLATIRQALQATGLYDESLVVVTSDHGEAFWQHGLVGHSRQVYDEMVHVPLVMRFPDSAGVDPGRVDALTSLMDLFPSICAWMDLPAPQQLDGRPLAGIFGEPADPDRELYLRSYQRTPSVALRTLGRKVMIDRLDPEAGELELVFDLTIDPGEEAAGHDPEALARLRAIAAEMAALEAGSVRSTGPTAAEQDLIENLGYTE